MVIKLILAVSVLAFTHSSAQGEVYKWVDDKGVVTFKEFPPPPSKKRKVKVYGESDFQSAPARQTAPSPQATPSREVATAQPSPKNEQKVEVYMTSWCGYCKKTLKYLDSKGVSYVAYDIEKDSAANQRYLALGGRGVPLVVIGANKIAGFAPESIDRYLRASK